jgi:hypothetical protein
MNQVINNSTLSKENTNSKELRYTYLQVFDLPELKFSVETRFTKVMMKYNRTELELYIKLKSELNAAMILKGKIMSNYAMGLMQTDMAIKHGDIPPMIPPVMPESFLTENIHMITPNDTIKEKLVKLRLLYLDDLKAVLHKVDSLKSAIPKEIGIIPYLDFLTIYNAVSEWTEAGYINAFYIPKIVKKAYNSYKQKNNNLTATENEQIFNSLNNVPADVLNTFAERIYNIRKARGLAGEKNKPE